MPSLVGVKAYFKLYIMIDLAYILEWKNNMFYYMRPLGRLYDVSAKLARQIKFYLVFKNNIDYIHNM